MESSDSARRRRPSLVNSTLKNQYTRDTYLASIPLMRCAISMSKHLVLVLTIPKCVSVWTSLRFTISPTWMTLSEGVSLMVSTPSVVPLPQRAKISSVLPLPVVKARTIAREDFREPTPVHRDFSLHPPWVVRCDEEGHVVYERYLQTLAPNTSH